MDALPSLKTSPYQYDTNGNLISDSTGRSITWSPFDKPTQITNLLSTLNFTYGADRARIIQTDNSAVKG